MHKNHDDMSNMGREHYRHLLIMAVLSFMAMYILMYAMVDTIGNVYNNFNQFYMAGLMTAPMILIELFVMRSMYQDQQRNMLIIAASILAGIAFFFLIRQQGAISEKQFLRSMIPHHAGAILMCEEAELQDADIEELCNTIIASQQAEIDQMKAKLQELEQEHIVGRLKHPWPSKWMIETKQPVHTDRLFCIGSIPTSRQIVIYMYVDHLICCDMLHADPVVAVQVRVRAHMLVVVHIMVHRHLQAKP